MIYARIEFLDLNRVGRFDSQHLVVALCAGYGASADIAHELLMICLTAPGWPVVIDAAGVVTHVPRDLLRSVVTWAEHAGSR